LQEGILAGVNSHKEIKVLVELGAQNRFPPPQTMCEYFVYPYAQTGQYDKARELIEILGNSGVPPIIGLSPYKRLIAGAAFRGDTSEVQSLLNESFCEMMDQFTHFQAIRHFMLGGHLSCGIEVLKNIGSKSCKLITLLPEALTLEPNFACRLYNLCSSAAESSIFVKNLYACMPKFFTLENSMNLSRALLLIDNNKRSQFLQLVNARFNLNYDGSACKSFLNMAAEVLELHEHTSLSLVDAELCCRHRGELPAMLACLHTYNIPGITKDIISIIGAYGFDDSCELPFAERFQISQMILSAKADGRGVKSANVKEILSFLMEFKNGEPPQQQPEPGSSCTIT
jgi:hypothetical protein